MKNILNSRVAGEALTENEAREIMLRIGQGEINPSQIAAFLSSYWFNPIQVDELKGFVSAMLDLAVTVDLSEFDAMDVCGTGGDGKDTFNISTTSSFIIVGAGQKIAKHGNHGVSSSVGSSTVLEFLGLKFNNDPKILKRKMETSGMCFLHAPLFHPAMRFVGPIRKELGMKTFFNLLGPLLNPAKVTKQISGVYSLEAFQLYEGFFADSGKQYGIVYAEDGYDEISLTSGFKFFTKNGEQIINPEDLGQKRIQQSEIFGGNSVADAAKIFTSILDGNGTEAQNNVVLTNAAFALKIVDQRKSFETAFLEAKESLFSLRAKQTLEKLVSI